MAFEFEEVVVTLGGSFNPPHLGHLSALRAAREVVLEMHAASALRGRPIRVTCCLVPAFDAWVVRKLGAARTIPAEHRIRLCALACDSENRADAAGTHGADGGSPAPGHESLIDSSRAGSSALSLPPNARPLPNFLVTSECHGKAKGGAVADLLRRGVYPTAVIEVLGTDRAVAGGSPAWRSPPGPPPVIHVPTQRPLHGDAANNNVLNLGNPSFANRSTPVRIKAVNLLVQRGPGDEEGRRLVAEYEADLSRGRVCEPNAWIVAGSRSAARVSSTGVRKAMASGDQVALTQALHPEVAAAMGQLAAAGRLFMAAGGGYRNRDTRAGFRM